MRDTAIGYTMPDGSTLFAHDGASRAAMAWAVEALKEFREMNQRLKRIEKRLTRISPVEDGEGEL